MTLPTSSASQSGEADKDGIAMTYRNGVTPRSTAERLAAQIAENPETGCLEWQGYLGDGYGRIRDGLGAQSRTLRAHVVAYELARGPVPDGMVLDHLCQNRRCCNPNHLEPVTRRENTLRGSSPPAANARAEVCRKGHPFTPENTLLVKGGTRQCLACRRAREARNNLAHRSRTRGAP